LPNLPGNEILLGLLTALGSGLLIGIERERRKGTGSDRALAGVRTFTLAAMAGAVAQALEQPWLVAAGAALVLALAAIAYWRDKAADPGVTTEIALFVTYLLGVAAIAQPAATAAGAVIVAALLAARNRMHRFAIEVLSAAELRDALILAGAALVLLPALPDVPVAWLGGLNMQRIWALAVLIMALQGAGYVAQRWLGARRGLALAGLASGFVSSTATIAALGVRTRKDASLLDASVASALFSTMATFIQFAIVAAAVHLPSLAVLAVPLAAGLLVTSAAAALFFLRARDGKGSAKRGRAFNLLHATLFAFGLAAVTAIVGIVNEHAGAGAAQWSAALAGFADAHAAGAAVLSLVADGRMPLAIGVWACLLGISTNAASKLAVAFFTGGASYGLRVGAGLSASLAAAWLGAYLIV
jgi:uncharacterized membrane protein (DUF4010 family)